MKWSVTGLPREKAINAPLISILDFPHRAFIVIGEVSDVEGEVFTIKDFGSGVLINQRWLLTAAHVMLNKGPITSRGPVFQIILGMDKFDQTGVVTQAELYKCHPNFGQNLSFYDDLCLVKTRDTIQYSDRVQPGAFP